MDAGGEDTKAGGEVLMECVNDARVGLEYLGVTLKSHSILKTNGDVYVLSVVNVFVMIVCKYHDDIYKCIFFMMGLGSSVVRSRS